MTKSGLDASDRGAGRGVFAASAPLAGEIRQLADFEAVHVAAALEQDGRSPALVGYSRVVVVVIDDAVRAAGSFVAGEFPGKMALADDDALVAAAAVDDEIAEAVGIDPVVVGAAAGRGGNGEPAGHQGKGERQEAQSTQSRTHARHPSCGSGQSPFASSPTS